MFELKVTRGSTNPDEAVIERMDAGRIQISSGGVRVATLWMDDGGSVEVQQEWPSVPGKKPGDNDLPGFLYEPAQPDGPPDPDVGRRVRVHIAGSSIFPLDGTVTKRVENALRVEFGNGQWTWIFPDADVQIPKFHWLNADGTVAESEKE